MFGRNQRQITQGLKALQKEASGYSQDSYLKLRAMEDVYFSKTSIEYLPNERKEIEHFLDALIHKYHSATLALEQLWALSYNTRGEILEVVEFSLDRLRVSDDDLAIISFAFDTFLFHGRAYLDFYMLYICHILKTGQTGSISREKFYKWREKIDKNEFATQAHEVKNYFDTSVFGEANENQFIPPNWGTLITSLRDKIAHRDIVKPSFQTNETLTEKIIVDWPTIKGITYERFHQDMQNGMYCLIQDISKILYGITWIPGTYREGMFDE